MSRVPQGVEDWRIALRPRDRWCALDLGWPMARRWARPLYLIWMASSLPALALIAWFLHDQPVWAGFSIWLIKPVLDRPLLVALSELLPGRPANARNLLRWYGAGLRAALEPNVLWHLSVGRILEPSRALINPVLQLEGLRGPALWARLRLIRNGEQVVARNLTLSCALFELILVLGQFMLVLLFLPLQGADGLLDVLLEAFSSVGIASLLICWLAISVVEPVYVCAGFAQYLNRRSTLEGWDLELGLRALQRRLQLHHSGASR
ncbi:MAG: hypothetical protein KDK91_06105 [Gammaproteobacteria bacterium]|nr:hypothetical protein [Gammaproteobacteria bacterium]